MTSLLYKAFAFKPARAVLCALAAAAVLSCQSAQAASAVVEVYLDQARIVTLPDNVKTLIIGNPIIADVTLLKGGGTMVITGKGFGETNLIALDAQGKPVAESMIRVDASNATKTMVVQRGFERETYFCNPKCRPTVSLGDASKFSSDIAGQIGTRNSLAQPAAAGPAGSGGGGGSH